MIWRAQNHDRRLAIGGGVPRLRRWAIGTAREAEGTGAAALPIPLHILIAGDPVKYICIYLPS